MARGGDQSQEPALRGPGGVPSWRQPEPTAAVSATSVLARPQTQMEHPAIPTHPPQAPPDPPLHLQKPGFPGHLGTSEDLLGEGWGAAEPPQEGDLDFGFCRLAPKPLEGNSAPSSRKKPPLPLEEAPRKAPLLERGTSSSLPTVGMGKGDPKGREPPRSIHGHPPRATPLPLAHPSVCPSWSPVFRRKPVQEPPGGGVVGTSWRKRG